MEALLGLGEVANPQQLQGPVLHRVRAAALRLGMQGPKHQGRECLKANGIGTAPLALPLVTSLKESDRDGIAPLAGAGQAANALHNPNGGAGAETTGIQQQALARGDLH